MQTADLITWGSIILLLLGFLGIFFFILKSLVGQDLSGFFQEPDGKASISRFQLFLFTYVVGGLILILSLQEGRIIDVDPSVLGLIGLSGGSFIISKGIGKSGPAPASPPAPAADPAVKP